MSQRLATPDTEADRQIAHVLDERPPRGFVVVAGAGSGKTTSLVKALARVATTRGPTLRRRGQKVACITYTEVAAAEIEREVGAGPEVHVSTIHSFLWTVVRSFESDIGVWMRETTQAKLDKAKGTRAERYRAQLQALDGVERFTYGFAGDAGRGRLNHNDVLRMVPELILARPLLARVVAASFPYVFVDESQDTQKDVVACLKVVARAAEGRMALGFFGDPMQRIYPEGAGAIEREHGWEEITKPENFRSSRRVLQVVNRVRAEPQQIPGLPPEHRREGETWFFVLPADSRRDTSLERIRAWLTEHSDGDWTAQSASRPKVLMIMHEMAARRLGFHGLFEAFRGSGGPGSLTSAFSEGTAWPLLPFTEPFFP